MKKMFYMLLFFQSGLMMAQTETFVTANGKKVSFNPSAIITSADNGLTASGPNIQLGGALTKASVLTATSEFTLAINGLQPGTLTDQLVTRDANGILRVIPNDTWNTKGNTGTIPGTNFIGTRDNVDLVFKRYGYTGGLLGATNTAFGYLTMNPATATNTGSTAMGVGALRFLTTGNTNSAFGQSALGANTSGSANTALGFATLSANVGGNFNVALGYNAMLSNKSGYYNTGIGVYALNFNVDGTYNTGFGVKALYNNTSGNNNLALGMQALYNNTTGNGNIAIGVNAMSISSATSNNIAIGSESLNNITGVNNVAQGNTSLKYVKDGNNNVSIGDGSGEFVGTTKGAANSSLFSINNSVLLGALARPKSDNETNQIVIGYNAMGIGSNTVRIGNDQITKIEGAVAWSNPSDVRLKKDITSSTHGLDFVNKLRPVTYHMKTGTTDLQSGFIAQEVETAAKAVNYEFSGIVKPESEKDFYSLRYSEFVVPLVKAVQEQQQMIESQKADIAELKAQVKALLQSAK